MSKTGKKYMGMRSVSVFIAFILLLALPGAGLCGDSKKAEKEITLTMATYVPVGYPLVYEEQFVYGTVIEVAEENITVDGNHPLAGKDLKFEIVILDIAKEE